jgi:hypothetical protein
MKNTIFENLVIDESKANPFESDSVSKNNELKAFAENLNTLIDKELKNKASSLIISIYADWGIGKTTFIDMWGQSLIRKDFVALKFDAWKCDHSEEPFLPFMMEIYRQLNFYPSIAEKEKLSEAIIGVVAGILSSMSLNVGIPRLSANINFKEIQKNISECFKEKKSQIDKFKEELQKVIERAGKLYIFIDELDRCNPIFAIKLLEISKHLFNVKNICFILSINHDSLICTIRKIYGLSDEKAREYLERFFDFQLKMPEPDKENYAKINLNNMQDTLITKQHPFEQRLHELAKELFVSCCSREPFGFNLRDIEKQTREITLFLDINKTLRAFLIPIAIYFFCAKRKGKELGKDKPIFADELQKELFDLLLEIYNTNGDNEAIIKLNTDLQRRYQQEAEADPVKSDLLYNAHKYFFQGPTAIFVINYNNGFNPIAKIENYDVVRNFFDSFSNMLEFINKIEIEDDK